MEIIHFSSTFTSLVLFMSLQEITYFSNSINISQAYTAQYLRFVNEVTTNIINVLISCTINSGPFFLVVCKTTKYV